MEVIFCSLVGFYSKKRRRVVTLSWILFIYIFIFPERFRVSTTATLLFDSMITYRRETGDFQVFMDLKFSLN